MRAVLGIPFGRPRARAFLLTLALSATSCVAPTVADPSPTRTSPGGSRASQGELVLLVHATRPPISISTAVARGIIAGTVENWRALGERSDVLRVVAAPSVDAGTAVARAANDAAAIDSVQRDRSVLGIVPLGAVRAGVRAVSVDGIDPIRDPGRYPFRGSGAKPGPVVEMIVVGDVMLGRRVAERALDAKDPAFPLRLVAGRLADADLTVGNFEATLSRKGKPTQGDAFFVHPRAVAGLDLAGFDVLSLANNHTGDFGPVSLVETARILHDAGIQTIGAGANVTAARRPAIVERAGVTFGFLGFNAIGETPPPERSKPGAVRLRMRPRFSRFVPADLTAFVADVRTLRPRVDVLVVIPHWGEQYSHRAHPDQRMVARAVIDAGADLVIASHPHWVQGLELHAGKVIAHSLGNFVFDQAARRETQEGLALDLVFWGSELKAVELVPVRIGADFRPRFTSWQQGASILNDVFSVSRLPWQR